MHAFSHVTGGGLAANLARVLPDAPVGRPSTGPPGRRRRSSAWSGDWAAWPVDELERTLNMGVGMVALVAAADADRALALLTARGVPAWVLGAVVPGDGTVALHGTHPA